MVTCIQELRAWPLRGGVIIVAIVSWFCALAFIAYFLGLFLGDLKLFEDRLYYMSVFPRKGDLGPFQNILRKAKSLMAKLCRQFYKHTTPAAKGSNVTKFDKGAIEIAPWWMWSLRYDNVRRRRKKRMSVEDSWPSYTLPIRLSDDADSKIDFEDSVSSASEYVPGVSPLLQPRRLESFRAPITQGARQSPFPSDEYLPNANEGALGSESSKEQILWSDWRIINTTAAYNFMTLIESLTPATAPSRRSSLLSTALTNFTYDRLDTQSANGTVENPGFQMRQQLPDARQGGGGETPPDWPSVNYRFTFNTGRPGPFEAGELPADATSYPGRPPALSSFTYSYSGSPAQVWWGFSQPPGPPDVFAFRPIVTEDHFTKSIRWQCLALEGDYLRNLLNLVEETRKQYIDSVQGRLHFVIMVLDLVMVFLNSLFCISSYMLLLGAHRKNRVLLLPWICISGVCVYGNIIYIICHTIVEKGVGYFFGIVVFVIIIMFILIVLHVIGLIVVHRFIRNLFYRDRRRGRRW